jgi:hypothetical protein
MKKRTFLTSPLFFFALAGVGGAVALGIGCSSSSSPTTTSNVDGSTGSDTGTGADTSTGADTGATTDGGAHDGPPPDALYAACATQGSFGWPCTAAATGPDPTECTDPDFPDCFVGGQGAWCTKTCATIASCTGYDGGCVSTGCNGKGYCK